MKRKPTKPDHWCYALGTFNKWGCGGAIDYIEKPRPEIPHLDQWTEADLRKHTKFSIGEQTYLRRLGVLVPARATLPWVYTDQSVQDAYRRYRHAHLSPKSREEWRNQHAPVQGYEGRAGH